MLPAIFPSSLPNFQPCLQPILDTKTRRHSLGTFRTVNLVFPLFNKCSVSHYKPPRPYLFSSFHFFLQPASQSVSQSLSNNVRQSKRVNQQVQRGQLNVNSTYFLFAKWPQQIFKNIYLSQYLTNLMHKICITISFISGLYMFRAHVLIIRRSKLYYTASGIIHTYRWPSRAYSSLNLCTERPPIRVNDTRGCVMQFWPPDDEHMCSKHVDAWNKTLWYKFCASSWLNTEINILRCTVNKTSKFKKHVTLPVTLCYQTSSFARPYPLFLPKKIYARADFLNL